MSKFDKIFEAREKRDEIKTLDESDARKGAAKTKSMPEVKSVSSPAQTPREREVAPLSQALPIAPKRGRPAAKRSDPDYIGFTTYIRKVTHLNVKIALLKGENQELSELVEDLLTEWLKKR